MRCGIQFQIEKEGKNGKERMKKSPSVLFLFLPSFQQLSVVRKEEETRGARNEGRRKNSLANFSCYN